jgi:hypothetical protein
MSRAAADPAAVRRDEREPARKHRAPERPHACQGRCWGIVVTAAIPIVVVSKLANKT